jgi:hypothetical protein
MCSLSRTDGWYHFCQVMGAYGYSIEQTLIVDVEPDLTVRRAMNEINAGEFSLQMCMSLWKTLSVSLISDTSCTCVPSLFGCSTTVEDGSCRQS